MKQLTIKELLELCKQQVKKGNGDKKIVISDDNEGNGYHGLFYTFTEIEEEEKEYYPIYDSETKDIKEIIILG
jgi:hypothetical protein